VPAVNRPWPAYANASFACRYPLEELRPPLFGKLIALLDEVVLGCCEQLNDQGGNLARSAALQARYSTVRQA